MKEKIEKFLEYFAKITKEESDYIESILKWDDETKMAFMMAKRIFEEDLDEYKVNCLNCGSEFEMERWPQSPDDFVCKICHADNTEDEEE